MASHQKVMCQCAIERPRSRDGAETLLVLHKAWVPECGETGPGDGSKQENVRFILQIPFLKDASELPEIQRLLEFLDSFLSLRPARSQPSKS